LISGIVLAAGTSERMGRPKQAIRVAGRPMLEYVVNTFLSSGLQEVIVVVNPELSWRPRKRGRLRFLVNERFGEGISTSVRAGIEAIRPECDAVAIGLGDKPLVRGSTIGKLMIALERSESEIIVPVYRGKRGNPILLRRSLFPEVRRLKGDSGAKVLVESGLHTITEVPVSDIGVILDVNTRSDLERVEKLIYARGRLAKRKSRK